MSQSGVAVGVIGSGLIGTQLLRQFNAQAKTLSKSLRVDMHIAGISSSRNMLLKPSIDLDGWQDELQACNHPASLAGFGEHLLATSQPNKVIIDCTAADEPADLYSEWMSQGIHIITPNKKFHSGPMQRLEAARQLQYDGKAHYFYEAIVGAGLPLTNTLKGLVETGDEVVKIEGIVSGTLSYIFNTYAAGMDFSQVVADAKAGGYTEPDPRDDLSGLDVARKVVILAREAGASPELSDVAIDSLVPESLRDATAEEFMAALPDFDADMAARAAAAAENGQVLRYVGTYDAATGECSAALKLFDEAHPFASLTGTDNVVSFTTRRYSDNPLIVRGPGAGADVTAAGVFADLMQLLRYLGAPSGTARK